MIVLKVIACVIILFAAYLFYHGIRYRESSKGASAYMTQVRFIGSSILVGMLGYYLFKSDKSLCELFAIFC